MNNENEVKEPTKNELNEMKSLVENSEQLVQNLNNAALTAYVKNLSEKKGVYQKVMDSFFPNEAIKQLQEMKMEQNADIHKYSRATFEIYTSAKLTHLRQEAQLQLSHQNVARRAELTEFITEKLSQVRREIQRAGQEAARDLNNIEEELSTYKEGSSAYQMLDRTRRDTLDFSMNTQKTLLDSVEEALKTKLDGVKNT